MQKYEAIQKLSPTEFRRLTGVRKETFVQMISIVKEAEKKRNVQGGKPSGLVVEDKLLQVFYAMGCVRDMILSYSKTVRYVGFKRFKESLILGIPE